MRKAIARRLSESIGPVPHFFLTTEIDMGRVLDLRSELNARQDGFKIGVNDILLKTAAEALVHHPEVNASWDGDAIQHHGSGGHRDRSRPGGGSDHAGAAGRRS